MSRLQCCYCPPFKIVGGDSSGVWCGCGDHSGDSSDGRT